MVNITLRNSTFFDTASNILHYPVEYAKSLYGLRVADQTIKIDSIKLIAGFPFGEFEMPELKYECLKNDVISGKWGKGCKSYISSGLIKGSVFNTKFNVPPRKDRIIKAENTIVDTRKDLEHTPLFAETFVGNRYSPLWSILNDSFKFEVSDSLEMIDFDGEAIFESGVDTLFAGYIEFLQSLTLKQIFYKSDKNSKGDIVPINYEGVKNIIKTLHWAFYNFTPTMATIDGSQIIVPDHISLVNPITQYDTVISLDSDQIIKSKTDVSKVGFEIGEYTERSQFGYEFSGDMVIEAFKIKPIGNGVNHIFENSDSMFITVPSKIMEDLEDRTGTRSVNLQPFLLHGAKAMAKHYDDLFTANVLEIETLETTSVVPHSKVIIDGVNYTCTEAEIPYKNYELFKYKLQELK